MSLKRLLARLLNSALRRRDDNRLQEEIEEHLALQTADNLRAGLSPSDRRHQSRLTPRHLARRADLAFFRDAYEGRY